MAEPSALRAVRGRTWALLAVAVALAAGLCLVGAWQWRSAVDQPSATLPADPPGPVAEVIPAGEPLRTAAVGRQVSARGTYDPDAALLVTDHRQDGRAGAWLLVPLRTSDGAVLPVVRGFLPEPLVVPSPPAPAGGVAVTGRVQVPYSADQLPGRGAGAGGGPAARLPLVPAVDTADLVNRWGGPIHPAFVVAEAEQPAKGAAVTGLDRVPAQALGATSSVQWRNLAYALQWYVFAGFVLLLWLRLARDDVRAALGASPGAERRVPG